MIDSKSISIGVIGGIGLGMLLGSEFSGTYITLFGAVLTIIAIILIVFLSYKNNKKN